MPRKTCVRVCVCEKLTDIYILYVHLWLLFIFCILMWAFTKATKKKCFKSDNLYLIIISSILKALKFWHEPLISDIEAETKEN